ncbi:cyclic nucleotide-binding domain-containing protein 2 [Nothoprocta perdicaria]|uniref:cyclic nucleotide-binding domain-containing protein 2 n=1 Tax=Nothoprocta perdicaria TaxID=30464 RepID=UPI000E1B8020|nr:cyclic nucleotide-binding domain-containing protein 2 [Nothoprocta perdicaria]
MFSQDNLPLRVIQITRKRPEWRTEEEVKFVQSCLQEIESYGSYSLRLQFLLAKVVRFEWFERGRVILKKGQCGISFYFIYFGSVALTDDEDGSSTLTALYPVVLQKGAKFGEVSVLKGTRRVATVICLEDTKLFVVDKDDFFANKLDEELQEELCYRYNFIKGVKFFEKWSKRSIVRITNSSKMEKFYYGQVITKDITKSDSVILISKGTCEILHLVDLTACPSYHKWVCRQLTHLPKVPCLTRKTGAVSRKKFEDFPQKTFPEQHLRNLKAQDLKCDMSQNGKNVSRHPLDAGAEKINQNLEKQQAGGHSSYDECGGTKIQQREAPGLFHKTRTILTPSGKLPTDLALTVCMRVAEIHEGEIVGISQHFFPDHMQDRRNMVLVSKDAEVIWLKKDTFEKLLDLGKVLELHKRYPSDDELCQKFLEENQWKMIKKDLTSSIIQRKCAPKITPVFEKPGEHVHNSWTINQAGILDLSMLHHKHQQYPHRFVPVYMEPTRQQPVMPEAKLRLIHSIISPHTCLKGLF